ncbi:MAG TPA: cold-shock protein [Phototrophicaceae bacterium]|jgi:CspA family cold shock protein|nr:cold-shock protein [Phototrophicaceae bacterium]
MAENTITGVVKWFNNTKGFGFITVDGRNSDVFVHYSAITGNGYRSLEEGDQVTFVIGQGQKGEEARDVQKLPKS